MSPLEWFVVGGPMMWLILLLALSCVPMLFLALREIFRPATKPARAGIVLLVMAVLIVTAGAVGYSRAMSQSTRFAKENNITDPEFFEVFGREARVPLEAASPIAAFVGGIGAFAIYRVKKANSIKSSTGESAT